MFDIGNLALFTVDVEFSQPLNQKQDASDLSFFDKISLSMLKSVEFPGIQLALNELNKIMPNIEFNKTINKTKIRIGLFEYRRLKLIIVNDEPVLNLGEKSESKIFDKDELLIINNDFNFILGTFLGIKKSPENPIINVNITFQKKGKFISDQKIQALNGAISQILDNPKTLITGFNLEIIDSSDKKHQISITQPKDSFKFKDTFQLKLEGPVNTISIFENSLKLSNELCNKICCEQ